jgi:hypothetical protein
MATITLFMILLQLRTIFCLKNKFFKLGTLLLDHASDYTQKKGKKFAQKITAN